MIPRDLEHSRHRARLRELVLFDLAEHKTRTLGEISKATGIRPSRVLGIMVGDGDEYAFDLSLVAQGAATAHEFFGGWSFAITPDGAAEVDRIVRERQRSRQMAPDGATREHAAPPGATRDRVGPAGGVTG